MSSDPPVEKPFLPGTSRPASGQPMPILRWAALSVSGTKKSGNEDAWLAFASDREGIRLLAAQGTHSLAQDDLFFAVSDGVSGGRAGDIASNFLLDELSRVIPGIFSKAAAGLYPDYLTHLENVIGAVHSAINKQAEVDPDKAGMAATIALAWFTPENLYLVNAGDSRIYRCRDGALNQLTVDHSFAWQRMKRGDCTEREYRASPRRSALYQIVGGGHQGVIPHIAAVPFQAGDQFLICTDGLVDGLWDKHILSAFQRNQDSPEELAHALMTRATSNDGSDDTTLIAINLT